MRASGDKNDPDYFGLKFHGFVTVKLDGKEVRDAIEADDERNYVVFAERDEHGNIKVVGDEIATARVTGDVEIIGERI